MLPAEIAHSDLTARSPRDVGDALQGADKIAGGDNAPCRDWRLRSRRPRAKPSRPPRWRRAFVLGATQVIAEIEATSC